MYSTVLPCISPIHCTELMLYTILPLHVYVCSLLLMQILEVKMKRLNSTPASLPLPDPEEILRNLAWLDGLDSGVIDHVVQCASLVQFECGDTIYKEDELMECIYVIVSGLVKASVFVCACVHASVCCSPMPFMYVCSYTYPLGDSAGVQGSDPPH